MNGAELRSTWRTLVRIYPAWSILSDFVFSPSTYRLWGTDLLSSVFVSGRARKVATALSGLSPSDLDALSKLASINTQRAAQLFSVIATSYVSLPLTLAALASGVAPEAVRVAISCNMTYIAPVVVALAVAPASYFFAMWRARQLHWSVELVQAGAMN